MIQIRKISASVFGLFVPLIPVAGSHAQEPRLALEEVLVTAQKREQSLQEVPLSVNVMSEEYLRSTGTRSFEDLRAATPGLFISGSRDGQAQGITLRGVGSQAYTDVQRPNVGVFVDGVPKRRLDGAFNQLVDIERVEILKGPQSTLYGKEVSAGAVIITTQKPDPTEFEGRVQGSFGSDDLQEYEGMLNVPIGELFALRANVYYSTLDDQVENILGSGVGNLENEGGRFRLAFQPSETFDAILSYEYNTTTVEDNVLERSTYGTQSANFTRTLSADPFDRKVESALVQGRDNTNQTYYLHLNWQLSDRLSLSSITSYNEFERFQDAGRCVSAFSDPVACRNGAGGDGGYLSEPVLVFGFPEPGGDPSLDRTTTQELRLIFDSENLQSQVGFFYNDFEFVDETVSLWLPLTRIPGFAPDGLAIFQGQQFYDEDWSVFTHNTYRFTERWEVIFGLSYSESDRERDRFSYLNAGVFATPQTFNRTPTEFYEESYDNISGTLKAAYHFNDTVSFYGGVATGFRPGGFNNAGAPGFDEETSESWELGMKGEFFNGRLRLNSSVFYQTFDDYQVQSFDLALGALGNVFTNAAKVEIPGIELDFTWAATAELTIDGAVSYVDARYDSFEGAPCSFSQASGAQPGCETIVTDDGTTIQVQDLSGDRLANNSPFTANLNAEYRSSLSDGFGWYVRGEYVYRDDYFGYTNLEPLTHADNYQLFNARLGLIAADGGWEVALWAKNLADEDYITTYLPGRDGDNNGDGLVVIPGFEPTYGVDLEYRFGGL